MANLLLVVVSTGGVLAAAMVFDRAVGTFSRGLVQQEDIALVFPPNTEEIYPSVEFDMFIHSNELGMRDHAVPPKSEGVCRVAVIGDSFTFGWGVALEEAWIKLLEQGFNEQGRKVEFLNLGKPGAGIPQYVEIAERAIPILQPDLVLVGLLQGDDLGSAWRYVPPWTTRIGTFAAQLFPNITRLIWRRKNEVRTWFEPSNSIEERKEERRRSHAEEAKAWADNLSEEHKQRLEAMWPEAREAVMRGELNISLAQMTVDAPDFMMNVARPDTPFVLDSMRSAGDALRHLRQFCAIHGAALAAVSIPHGIYVNRPAMENYAKLGMQTDAALLDAELADEVFMQACDIANISMGKATVAFQERRDDATLYYRLDGHFTAAGNRLFADSIHPWMQQQLELACPTP